MMKVNPNPKATVINSSSSSSSQIQLSSPMAWNCGPLAAATPVSHRFVSPTTRHHFAITHTRTNHGACYIQQQSIIRIPKSPSHTPNLRPRSKTTDSETETESSEIECIGTGLDVECVISQTNDSSDDPKSQPIDKTGVEVAIGLALLVSPFFFWGTAMVAMKEVLPKAGPFFVAAFRLIPAGFSVVGFAASRGVSMPSGVMAWVAISAFALVDGSCFQGFLAEGLERTTAGLGSVIIDSQPLTVAILASIFFGESIGFVGAAGLVLGVIGLLLLEVPALSLDASNFSLWGSGELWMLLAAQSMAVGTVMVRWVSKYSDPIMATGWHMVIGGLPLVAISILNHDPGFNSFTELTTTDVLALLYTSIFGSAISYGLYFYNATRGSLTKLSSLTFLTPMFASVFGYIYLEETFTPVQLVGALITIAAIYMVNYKSEEA